MEIPRILAVGAANPVHHVSQEEILARRAPHPGDRGVMIALGPGFAAERGVLQW